MRTPHYLRSNESQEYPRHCIWVDTETTPIQVTPDLIKHKLEFGWACYRRRSRGHSWSKPRWFKFTNNETFWGWVTSIINVKESYTLFAHNGSFDLPVLDAFGWFQADGWKLTNAVIESPPIILKWRKDGKSIRFIDTLNIWQQSLADIGKSVGIEKLDMPDGWDDVNLGDEYCKRDVEIIMVAVISWFDFIRKHDLGGFAPTLASQAMRAYRHRFMQAKILIDDNEEALRLARAAYHGGRTECFYIGKLSETLYQLDINSQYPSVMKKEYMPTKLIGLYRRLSEKELLGILKSHCVISDVLLRTNEPVFPVYDDGKLIFPIGEFRTELSTPEIKYALENNLVLEIGLTAIYERAILFEEYVDFFYTLRQRYKEQKAKLGDTLSKILLNSLYGKFGQMGRVFETIAQTNDTDICTWVELDVDTMETHNFRQFAGMVQEQKGEAEGRDSHPAIAAHVTAHARMMMWEIYKTADLENCYYTDTDCVVVNKIGRDRLESFLDDKELGKLKLEHEITSGVIHGPKDYIFNNDCKIKGVKKSALWLSERTVEQESWAGLKGLIAKGDLTAPTTLTMQKTLKRQYTKGIVLVSGRTKPFERVT